MLRGKNLVSGRELAYQFHVTTGADAYTKLLRDAARALEASQAEQKIAAPHFSPFDSFIELNENKISDILAWMLNPSGSHAQGTDFLNSFFLFLRGHSERKTIRSGGLLPSVIHFSV